jgi:hypothetical protein
MNYNYNYTAVLEGNFFFKLRIHVEKIPWANKCFIFFVYHLLRVTTDFLTKCRCVLIGPHVPGSLDIKRGGTRMPSFYLTNDGIFFLPLFV